MKILFAAAICIPLALGMICAQVEVIHQQRKAIIELAHEIDEVDRMHQEALKEGISTLSELRWCDDLNDKLVEDLENYDMDSQWQIETLEDALDECRRERGPK